jgi:putative two-component system response regulator
MSHSTQANSATPATPINPHSAGERSIGGIITPMSPNGLEVSVTLANRVVTASDTNTLLTSIDDGLNHCQRLHGDGKPFEALTLSKAIAARVNELADRDRERRALTMLGILRADTSDFAGALDSHVAALRIATEAKDDVNASRVWNNIGVVFLTGGQFEIAISAFEKSNALTQKQSEPVFSRFSALGNLAYCYFRQARFADGLVFAQRALKQLTPEFVDSVPYAAVVLNRNLVRLNLALSKLTEAEQYAHSAQLIADKSGATRSRVAALTARAACEMARKRYDFGLTRIDESLLMARTLPAALPDALACASQAEEIAGHTDRALLHFNELSNLTFARAVSHVRQHVELATLEIPLSAMLGMDMRFGEAARLQSRLSPPSAPSSWNTLVRLSSAAMHPGMASIASIGHGARVASLARLLALEMGRSPIEANEIAMAVEVHDIGISAIPESLFVTPQMTDWAIQNDAVQHCRAGAQMLHSDTHARMLLAHDVAYYHHAHWDGSGFPAGVAGEAIPLAARICAVADQFDEEMTRAEDVRRSAESARLKVKSMAGRELDPLLVARFDAAIQRESIQNGIDWASDNVADDFVNLITALSDERGVF